MIYRAKKDRFTLLIVVALLAAMIPGVEMIYASIVDPMSQLPESGRVPLAIGGVGTIAICALVLWGFLSASYEVAPEKLIVRFGPVRLRYQLSSITEAIATRVPLGAAWSFATSWDMVYIRFRKYDLPLAISPANKAEFLRELAERVPGLRVRGEGTQEDPKRLEL